MPKTKITKPEEAPEMTATLDLSALADSVEQSDQIIRSTRKGTTKVNPFIGHVGKSRETGATLQLVAPSPEAAKAVLNLLRAAASDAGHGLRTSTTENDNGTVTVRFVAKDRKQGGSEAICPTCAKMVSTTVDGHFRVHGPRDNRCEGSGTAV